MTFIESNEINCSFAYHSYSLVTFSRFRRHVTFNRKSAFYTDPILHRPTLRVAAISIFQYVIGTREYTNSGTFKPVIYGLLKRHNIKRELTLSLF